MSGQAEFDTRDWYTDAEHFPQFTRGEIEVFVEAFKEFDEDKSGAISASELTKALEAMGQGCSQDDIDLIFSVVDEDKSGEIEWPEFLKIMELFYPDRKKNFVRNFLEPADRFLEFSIPEILVFVQNFREFDSDNSGGIDIKELGVALQTMGQGFNKDELAQLFDHLQDGSGSIRFEGFLELMRGFYPEKMRDFKKKILEPAKKFPHFNHEDILTFASAFRAFDLDGSGTIDLTELQRLFQVIGQGVSPKEVQKIMDTVDKDGSGDLDFSEFLEIQTMLYPEKRSQFVKEFLVPAKEFYEFSRAEILVFVETFKEFDFDNSGTIDKKELVELLKYMGQPSSEKDAERLVTLVDREKTGQVNWHGFLQIQRIFYPEKRKQFEENYYGTAKKYPGFTREEVSIFIEAFQEFDIDGSGTISADELAAVFAYMGQGSDPAMIRQILDTYDTDRSGDIDWSEYLDIMKDGYKARGRDVEKGAAASPAIKEKVQHSPAQAKKEVPAQPVKQTPTAPAQVAPKQVTPAQPTQPAQQPSGFQPAKPAQPQTKSPVVGTQRGNVCSSCGKTVYPIEAVSAAEKTWHKGCFKCEQEGCNVSLTLKTFTASIGKVYCSKHVPKEKPTAVAADGNLVTATALSAPKVQKAAGIQKNARMTFGADELQKK